MRYLAIDYGDKRTGLAICDPGGMLASPLDVLNTDSRLIDIIGRIAGEYGVGGIVVGLPLNMDGSEGKRARKVRAFAEKLGKALPVPVIFHDERLSSFAAGQKLAQMELTRKGRKKRQDALAAAVILESFLEGPGGGPIKGVNAIIAAGPDELAKQALDIFADSFDRAVCQRDRFFAAISGGRTPEGFFRLLSKSGRQLPWDKIELFWADERCVGPDDPAGNYNLADRTFLRTVPLRQPHIHPICCEGKTPQEAAIQYEAVLREVFGPGDVGFDLIMLGLGQDGHIASLMPGSASLNTNRLTAAQDIPAGGYTRVTLTAPVLLNAGKIVVMVCGSEKRATVRSIFTSDYNPEMFPVHLLWPALDRVVWLMDEAAGGGLLFEGS